MSTNVVDAAPYLRTSRNFPQEAQPLAVEVNRSYIDIANKVNYRTIGIFPSNVPAITGESWFINNQRQQTLRQIYSFGSISPGTELDIPTNINPSNIVQFTRIYGTVITSGGAFGNPDYRPLPYIDPNALNVGMAILVGTISGQQQIRIVLGAAALQVSSGIAVLEWLSNV